MCEMCDWNSVLARIDSLLDTGRFDFAEDTLQGIYAWVEENEHVTDKQRDAVENIAESKGY